MTGSTRTSNNATAAIVFAAFAVVCIAAFFAYRGDDIGRLPQVIGNLSGGSWLGLEIFSPINGLLAAVAIYLSWSGLGRFILVRAKLLPEKTNHTFLYEALIAAVGAAAWSLIWFFLGLFGLLNGYVAAAAVVFGFGVGLWGWSPRFRRPNREERKDLGQKDKIAGIIILGILLLGLVASIAPPIAKDTLLYHFSVPKSFIAQGSNAFVEGNIASYLSLGTEMHVVWAMLLGGLHSPRAAEAAAGATNFLFFPLLLTVISGWARQLRLGRWRSTATAAVAAIPTAYHVASSGYVDLALALYVTLAAWALVRWWKEQTCGSAILIGIFLGAALSIKLTTVFVIAAFALIVLLRARESKDGQAGSLRSDDGQADGVGSGGAGRVVLTGFGALVLAGVIASPWYIRTWAETGSPIFPFYMRIWPGKAPGWDVERSNLFQGMNTQYGGVDVDKLNYLTAPVRLSVAAQPEQPVYYDGVLGVAFLIGLPLLGYALWKLDVGVEVKIMAGVAGVMYLFWLFSSEQLRYLLPIVPLLAIAIASSAEKIGGSVGKVARYALIAAAFGGMLTSFAWFAMKAPLRVVLGGETRDEYLTRNLDYYPYYAWLNGESGADERTWLINMRRDTYHIERPVFSDYIFEDWTLRKMVWDARSADELRQKTREMGVNYVLARHDFLFDHDRSTLVDDRKPRPENEAKLKIAKEFLLDPARTVRSDEKFSLIRIDK